MLDAYIIDRIRREREIERREGGFVPLRIEVPRGPPPGEEPAPRKSEEDGEGERGSAIIDFTI